MAARKEETNKKVITDFSKRHEIFKNSGSYKSLFYGVITVMILFIIGIGSIKFFLNRPKPEIDSQAVSISRIDEEIRAANSKNNKYIVQENESLWDIAVKKYNDGYKWVDIAKENNIVNPDLIYKDDKLIIPALIESEQSIEAEMQVPSSETAQVQKITDKTYTVKTGDDLWNIAVRVYGDGYRWAEIASANNLADPGLIFSGNVLTIPR